jgi:hypothetical protein
MSLPVGELHADTSRNGGTHERTDRLGLNPHAATHQRLVWRIGATDFRADRVLVRKSFSTEQLRNQENYVTHIHDGPFSHQTYDTAIGSAEDLQRVAVQINAPA